jgi:hypothetical protein
METVSGLFRIPCLGRSLRRIGLGTNAESIPVVTLDGSMPQVVEDSPLVKTDQRLSLCISISSVITLLTTGLLLAFAAGRPDCASSMMRRRPPTQATVPLTIHAYPVSGGVVARFAIPVFWQWSVNWANWRSTRVPIAEIVIVSSKKSRSGLSLMVYS